MKRLIVLLACMACAAATALPARAQTSAAGAVSGGAAPGAEHDARGQEMAEYMRSVLRRTQDPERVATLLARQGARFLAHQTVTVSFGLQADGVVVPLAMTTHTVDGELNSRTATESLLPAGAETQAGRKSDFRLRQWLYEWRNPNGTYTEQNVTSGHWTDPEWRWMDNPEEVIDVRWIVGDLAYVAAYPYDGVVYDQHTQGIASFTVDDQQTSWDLFVNFTPTSRDVYGKVTNVFTNYTHTWLGWRLSITLGAGGFGTTGSISIHTDARTWTKGTGLSIRIASEEFRGPAVGVNGGSILESTR